MAKTIIEYRGKRYQVVKCKDRHFPCRGCALEKTDECSPENGFPCEEFDMFDNIHILIPVENGTK